MGNNAMEEQKKHILNPNHKLESLLSYFDYYTRSSEDQENIIIPFGRLVIWLLNELSLRFRVQCVVVLT